MNVDTGELIRINEIGKHFEECFKKQGFTQVPEELSDEAEGELGEKDSVMVDMKKKTPLTAWAKRLSRAGMRNALAAVGRSTNIVVESEVTYEQKSKSI